MGNVNTTDPDAENYMDPATITFFKVYQGMMHIIPFVMTVINLAITDMNLNIDHWWIVSLVLFPGYALFNYMGSMGALGE